MIGVDTNVLIYACDKADPRRQQIALDLVTNIDNGVLLWQVACEFISASRKLSKQGFTSTQAWNRLAEFQALLPLVLLLALVTGYAGRDPWALFLVLAAWFGLLAVMPQFARERRWDAAICALTRAVQLEDAQTYGEPPDWHLPVRHTLGSVLIAAGRPVDAERTFREDLDRFPENGWSLLGLARSLEAQGRVAEAADARGRFERAFQDADVARTLMNYGGEPR